MRAPAPRRAAAAAPVVGPGRGLFAAVKARRTADALRYAGARMSTVGRRVVVTGRRMPLGEAVRLDDDARRILRQERSPVGYPCMATVRQAQGDEMAARPHWSEVDN